MPPSRVLEGEVLTERDGFSAFQGIEPQTSASELALRALEPVGLSSDSTSSCECVRLHVGPWRPQGRRRIGMQQWDGTNLWRQWSGL